MFPIRDSIPTRRFPIVNVCLIVLNILAFLWQLSLSPEELNAVYYTLGVVPGKYTGGNPQSLSTLALYLPFLTNMFLHGGWLHLIGNIWTLYIFGDNVE
ncbi:MAG: rhomboid family intramembrane serine protease, partial [Bacteroidota bacterium]